MIVQQSKISKTTVMLIVSGRLDAANASLFERRIKQATIDDVDLVLDFGELTYISSMGLRVLLHAMKQQKNADRKLIIKNMNNSVREVFEMTGFLNLMVQGEKFLVIRRDEPGCIRLLLNGKMQTENIPVISQELLEIRERNCTEINVNKINTVEELSEALDNEIKTGELKTEKAFTIILDMAKLDFISPGTGKCLKQAITETSWGKRTLLIQNAAENVLEELKLSELEEFLQ